MIKWYSFLPRNLRKKIKTRKLLGAPLTPRMTSNLFNCAKIALSKRLQIRDKGKIAENLILGSSHAKCGWISGEKDINLGMDSQDLYYSYNLYKNNIENLPNLKNIIIFYAVFSPGLDNEYTSYFYSAIAQHVYFSIPYHNEYRALEVGFSDFEKVISKKHFSILKAAQENSLEYIPEKERIVSEDIVKQTALNHLKNNSRQFDQNIYLENICRLATAAKHKVTILIPPFVSSYKSVLPEEKEVFKTLYAFAAKNPDVKIQSFYNSDIFSNEDFADYEHLNRQGAEKLTSLVNSNF